MRVPAATKNNLLKYLKRQQNVGRMWSVFANRGFFCRYLVWGSSCPAFTIMAGRPHCIRQKRWPKYTKRRAGIYLMAHLKVDQCVSTGIQLLQNTWVIHSVVIKWSLQFDLYSQANNMVLLFIVWAWSWPSRTPINAGQIRPPIMLSKQALQLCIYLWNTRWLDLNF